MPSLRSLIKRWRLLGGPAPMKDFRDYDQYWETRGQINILFRRWVVAAAVIEDGASVLDVGCGSGEFLTYLRSKKPNVKAAGIDFSEESVSMTQKAGFDARVLDFTKDEIGEKYDYVTCFEVLEHIPEAEHALATLSRAFTRQLIVSVPNVGSFGCRVRLALFGRFPVTCCYMHIKEHVRHWTPKDFRQMADHVGLRVIKVEGQYGMKGTPWRLWPSLFSSGVIYHLEQTRANTG